MENVKIYKVKEVWTDETETDVVSEYEHLCPDKDFALRKFKEIVSKQREEDVVSRWKEERGDAFLEEIEDEYYHAEVACETIYMDFTITIEETEMPVSEKLFETIKEILKR